MTHTDTRYNVTKWKLFKTASLRTLPIASSFIRPKKTISSGALATGWREVFNNEYVQV